MLTTASMILTPLESAIVLPICAILSIGVVVYEEWGTSHSSIRMIALGLAKCLFFFVVIVLAYLAARTL